MSTQPISAIVAAFGQTVRDKFASPVVVGAPEDQLRGPLEVLVRDGLAVVAGIAQPVTLIGETSLADIQTRPDYAVAVGKTLVGFIEVKAPGKGAESQKITVVIGNPPDKEKAEGQGGWVEAAAGGGTTAVMERWRRRRRGAWGVSAHAKHLKNLYVYFWCRASWKVFGSGHYAATGLPDRDEEGIVAFITVAGLLNGPGFQKMRADLRESCSSI